MKRPLPALAAFCLAAAGCSDSKVVVQASLTEGGAPVADLPVWILPYDRQALADSLVRDAGLPEPMVPAELVTQLEGLNAAEAAAGTDSARRAVAAARTALEARIDTVRARRVAWREQVFADFDSLARVKEGELGRAARIDTTNARGIAEMEVDAGRWWAWSVYVLPDEVLEWNVPFTMRGDSTLVTLTRENAEARMIY